MLQLDLTKDSGIKLDLTKEDPAIQNVRVLLNWDEHPVHKSSLTEGFDLDLWAFCLDPNNKINAVEKVVYFKNKDFNNGAVVLPRDNRNGVGDDDEEILIALSKLPLDVANVVVYCFIYDAVARGQHFGMMANASVQIINADTGNVLAKYDITKDFQGKTALAVGAVGRDGSFTPIGEDGTQNPNEILAFYQ